MKRIVTTTLIAAVTAFAGGQAMAQSAPWRGANSEIASSGLTNRYQQPGFQFPDRPGIPPENLRGYVGVNGLTASAGVHRPGMRSGMYPDTGLSRAEVRDETLQAIHEHEIGPMGETASAGVPADDAPHFELLF